MLEVIYGRSNNQVVTNELARVLKAIGNINGAFYIGYPVIASADDRIEIDALLASNEFRFSYI